MQRRAIKHDPIKEGWLVRHTTSLMKGYVGRDAQRVPHNTVANMSSNCRCNILLNIQALLPIIRLLSR